VARNERYRLSTPRRSSLAVSSSVLPTKHLFGHGDHDDVCDLPMREAGSLFMGPVMR
jgi:hypothetical protein